VEDRGRSPRVLVVTGAFGEVPAAAAADAVATGWRRQAPDTQLDLAAVPLQTQPPEGVQQVLERLRVPERAAAVDLVVTTAAVFGPDTLLVTVPRGAAWAAQRAGRPCVALAGRVLVGRREYAAAGFDGVYGLEDTGAASLAALAERVARTWAR